MIWLTWRQHRLEATVGGMFLLLVISIIIITGITMKTLYNQMGVAGCIVASPQCLQAYADFDHLAMSKSFAGANYYYLFWSMLLALPLLFGIFVGAPAGAREFEQGTYRLVWTQGVPWYRWLVVKVGLLAVTIFCVFTLLSFLLMWWSIPLSNVVLTIWEFYDTQGIIFPVYALFAFILGVTSGILVRRTAPAMFITLVVFIVLRVAIGSFWRPYFLPPLTYTFAFSATNPQLPAQAWLLNQGSNIIDRQGNSVPNTGPEVCASASSNANATIYFQCMDEHGFRIRTVYQPEDRFWLFQTFESSLYLFLSLCLFIFTYWWMKHKIIG